MQLLGKNTVKQNGRFLWDFLCPECKQTVCRTKQNGLRQRTCGCVELPKNEYGFVKVLGELDKFSSSGYRMYRLLCTYKGPGCKVEFEDDLKEIKRGKKESCGCLKNEAKTWTKNSKDYCERIIGFMKILAAEGRTARNLILWRTECIFCQNNELVSSENIRKRSLRHSPCSKCGKS